MDVQSIMNLSKVQLKTYEIYQKSIIKDEGPLDLKMGVGTKFTHCKTCLQKLQTCQGHFGHFNLTLPIFHIGYFKHLILILKCICKKCGSILLQSQIKKKYRLKMSGMKNQYSNRSAFFKKIISDCTKNKYCFKCGFYNPTIQKLSKVAGKIQFKNNLIGKQLAQYLKQQDTISKNLIKSCQSMKSIQITPLKALQLLKQIHKQDYPLLNVTTDFPINQLIIQTIIVPPVNIRPSVAVTNHQSNEDDLTMNLRDIWILNDKIQKYINQGDQLWKIMKDWYLMQSLHSQFINSDSPGLPIKELNKKTIRSLCTRLKGKQGRFRQNLSGKRSNFTGRTVISPDPNLHPSQVIIPIHMAKILTLTIPITQRSLPQLQRCVKRGRNGFQGANYIIMKDGGRVAVGFGKQLEIGGKVQRHLRDGDIVIFNRQPSLHRISMMGFKAKIRKGDTLRFNQSICAPFNADFDGDQMNIHVPQTYQAIAETKHLMGVAKNIMTPKSGEPIIALIQDFITSSYLLTSKEMFYDEGTFHQIMCSFLPSYKFQIPQPCIQKPCRLYSGKQLISILFRCNHLFQKLIINLQLKQKKYTQDKFMCWKDGYVVIKNSQLLLGQIGKITLGGNKNGVIYAILRDGRGQTLDIIYRFSRLSARWISDFGMTFGLSDVTPSVALKQQNQKLIQQAFVQSKQLIRKYQTNQMQSRPGLSLSQSLQSYLNQCLSKVREQVGDNCIKNLPKMNKPLIMAVCGSKGSPVNLSQMIGCLGQQTVGGKRIKYGFTQRTLPHYSRVSNIPAARGFVKNSFYSGLTAPQFFFHTMGGRQGLIDTAVKTAQTGYMQRRLIKLLQDITVMYDMTVRSCDKKQIFQFKYGQDGCNPMMTNSLAQPIDLKALYAYSKCRKPIHYDRNQVFMNKSQLKKSLQKTYRKLKKYKALSFLNQKQQELLLQQFCNFVKEKADQLGQKLKDYIGQKYGFTKQQFKIFVKMWKEKVNKIMMQAGQPVGALTAQSIGQPATQMTLKTFHHAGISSMNITQGVPRMNQIINSSPSISTPIITLYIYQEQLQNAKRIKNQIQYIKLEEIIEWTEEVYRKSGCWLQVGFDNQKMQEKNFKIQQIKKRIAGHPRIGIKQDKITILNQHRLKISSSNPKKNDLFQVKHIKRKIPQVQIKGFKGIKRVLINKQKNKISLFAQGTGMKEALSVQGINPYRSYSNHTLQVENVLGIQAARASIIKQISNTMRQHSVTVDPRHVILLAEVMTWRGKVTGFTRYGVDKLKDSTLMLASFQKTTDFLFDAAVMGKHDRLKGVSQKIITGNKISIGTGSFDLCLSIPDSQLI